MQRPQTQPRNPPGPSLAPALPGGASLQQLQKATGWQAHSVRGFLSGTLKKKMGLRVDSAKLQDGRRTYRVTSK